MICDVRKYIIKSGNIENMFVHILWRELFTDIFKLRKLKQYIAQCRISLRI